MAEEEMSNLKRKLELLEAQQGSASHVSWHQYQEDHHNFAGIEIQAESFQPNLYFVEIDNAAY